jgi:integrase
MTTKKVKRKPVKVRLTKPLIEALQPGDQPLCDTEVIGLQARPTAEKRVILFIVRARPFPGGRNVNPKDYQLGKYGSDLTLEEARKAALDVKAKCRVGQDPANEKTIARAKVAADKAAGTFKTAIENYLTIAGNGSKHWHDRRVRLLSDAMKPLHGLAVKDIPKAQLRIITDSVAVKAQGQGVQLFRDLRHFFNWAVDMGLVPVNPMAGMKGPKPIVARERVLEEHEIAAFWQASGAVSWPFSSVFRLLLLTGARREEVAGMRRSELDLAAALWTIPGARTKNKREHRVPLTETALALLCKADGELVFTTTGYSAPSGWSKSKRALDGHMRDILEDRFKPWRLHDLRRTCATGMEDLGIPTHIVETALNHVSGTKAGIVGVYQRAEHKERVRAAFTAWESRVLDIVSGNPQAGKVVQLRKSA